MVQRAPGDPVDGLVDEAERLAGLLVGQGDQAGPERRAGAGAAGPDEIVAAAWRAVTARPRPGGGLAIDITFPRG